MNEHKEEIIITRKGCLGSSDGKLLLRVAQLGEVPKSEYKRLAECKGLIEHTDIPYTAAMRNGDYIEDCIYQHLKATDERWQSNPMLTSEKYSRKNVKLISHVDFMLQDEENKVLKLIECKATKYSIEQTRQTYKGQLFVHWMLGVEYAAKLGKEWKVKLFLCHYNTEGLDLDNGAEFDTERLTIRQVRIGTLYNLGKTMDIVNDFMEDFNEFYSGDVIQSQYLPENVKAQFDAIATVLKEIKEREEKVEEFKRKLYSFMVEKEIKSIKCDAFGITRVDETTTKTFDAKWFLEDFKQKHPRKAEKVIAKFSKETKKKGYCLIKVNKNKDIEDIFK